MKNAANILYIIGIVSAALAVVASLLLLIFNGLSFYLIDFVYELVRNDLPLGFDIELFINAILAYYYFVVICVGIMSILALIFVINGKKALTSNETNSKAHVLCIVFGALSDNIFMIVGGILGLIASKRAQKPDETLIKEE